MYVGKKIRKLRLQLDLSQEEIAEQLGVSRSYYSAIEIGKRKITKKLLSKIKQLWNIDEGYFSSENLQDDNENLRGKYGGVFEGVSASLRKKTINPRMQDVIAEMQLYMNSNEYKDAELIEKELIISLNQEIRELIPVFEEYLTNQRLIMQFIYQYDKFFTSGLVETLLKELKSGKSKDKIISDVKENFKNAKTIGKAFSNENNKLHSFINSLQKFDYNNALLFDKKTDLQELVRKQQFHLAAAIRDMYNLLKTYPVISKEE